MPVDATRTRQNRNQAALANKNKSGEKTHLVHRLLVNRLLASSFLAFRTNERQQAFDLLGHLLASLFGFMLRIQRRCEFFRLHENSFKTKVRKSARQIATMRAQMWHMSSRATNSHFTHAPAKHKYERRQNEWHTAPLRRRKRLHDRLGLFSRPRRVSADDSRRQSPPLLPPASPPLIQRTPVRSMRVAEWPSGATEMCKKPIF
jgi:hypothetical protein